MGVWCDYAEHPPVLVQDRSIVCWEKEHTRMAVAALMVFPIAPCLTTFSPWLSI